MRSNAWLTYALKETALIPQKFTPYVFAFFMAFLMSGIMSLVISIFNVGLIDGILTIWLKAWVFSFVVAFPTVIIVSPVVRKLVAIVTTSH
jgi:hypothetical protein